MPERLWERLGAATGLLVWFLVVGVIYTGGWDQAIPPLYARYVDPAVPSELTGWPLKSFVLAGLTAALFAFYWPTINEWIDQARAFTRSLPAEPTDLLNIFEVHARLVEAWKRSLHASPDTLDRPLYDRLRQGSVTAWGRPSRRYAPTMKEPWPLRKPISKEFWEKHVVDDLQYWMEEKSWMHMSQPRTVTKPIGGKRSRQRCYWDLAFDEDEVEKLWPLPRSWMSA